MSERIVIQPEIAEAISNNMAVVALESTIISHGMSYPKNLETAISVEDHIRKKGAVPATIAIINGVIKVGLSFEELKELAQNKQVVKVSKRDLGYVISKRLTGATTVSATMLIAEMVGIKVFATGGIGGVHRGAESTFDISRDLEELASVNVCVVCAGIKSILDLGKTLEYLETKGVEVIGYQTDMLPAFYTRISDFKCAFQLDTAQDIANLMDSKWGLGLNGGIVIANPIPLSASLDPIKINQVIKDTIKESEKLSIKGKDNTPYLLHKVSEATKGESLKANIELVINNASLAAEIALAYSLLTQKKINNCVL